MAQLVWSIVEVKAEENSIAQALVFTMAKVTKDPDYQAYRKERKFLPKVRELWQEAGFHLSRGGGYLNSPHFSAICRSIG